MPWDSAKAEARIRRHLETVPEIDRNASLIRMMRYNEALAKSAASSGKFPRGRATLVDATHLYGQLLDFENLALQANRETEQSHARVLTFFNMHYRVWDSIVEDDDAIRVDYHGPRLHALVTDPQGDSAGQLKRAIALAQKLTEAAKQVSDAHNFPSRVRFGIDCGPCLAMPTGRSHERDVLLLGSPANHAAKLSADTEPGIYLTENAQRRLALAELGPQRRLTETLAKSIGQSYRFSRVDAAANLVASERSDAVTFQFHRAIPPLAKLNFEELVPSNSVRMGMASLFADIDGYTAYVDAAIRNGEQSIHNAVRDIHVLREELNSVLKEDFGGKRVRFIGDCIQGVIAEGDAKNDDPTETVREAAMCAAGMQSSFLLVGNILRTIDSLGLAVGIEYGPVPLTRIGGRGDESVRCAAGLAVVQSERLQQDIEGSGIRLGPVALNHADLPMREHFKSAVPIMTYADAADHFRAPSSPVVQIVRREPAARSHLDPQM